MSSSQVGHGGELYYEVLGTIGGHNCAYCLFSWHSQNTYYCNMVVNTHDLFGCSNMQRGEYCILNKQYSKEKYEKLKARLIKHMKSTGEWGLFFPMEKSMFAYNETVANDHFPRTKEQVLEEELKWHDEEQREIGSGPSIPDSIRDVTDDLLKETLVCEKTGRPYKIVPRELKLYRQLEIPIPHYAPETRNRIRWDQRNPRRTWGRSCAKCSTSIKTTYSPDRPETVYCEKCYLAEVY